MARTLFLTAQERSQVQRLYMDWLNYLKPQDIIGDLITEGILSNREQQEFHAKDTSYDKAEHLYNCCLIRATYPDLQKIRKILLDNGQKELANKLPVRTQGGAPSQRPNDERGPHPFRQPPGQPPSGQPPFGQPPSGQHPFGEPSARFSPPSSGHGSAPFGFPNQHQGPPQGSPHSRQNPPPSTNNIGSNPRPPNFNGSQAEPAPQPNNQPFANMPRPQAPNMNQMRGPVAPRPDGLQYYGTIGEAREGVGYCLVIANFTEKYAAYERDIGAITSFFRNKMHYNVVVEKNKPVSEIRDRILPEAAKVLDNQQQPHDRFFLYFLSEGEDNAMFGCRGTRPDIVYDLSGQPQNVKLDTEEIVKMFMHDRVQGLKFRPKVFFFQSATKQIVGGEDAQAAGGPQSSPSGENLAQSAAKKDILTVGADTLVCKAEQPGHLLAQQEQSWLIQHLMGILWKYYDQEHFVDMITQLNFELSRRVAAEGCRNNLLKVSHNLTEKLYLINP